MKTEESQTSRINTFIDICKHYFPRIKIENDCYREFVNFYKKPFINGILLGLMQIFFSISEQKLYFKVFKNYSSELTSDDKRLFTYEWNDIYINVYNSTIMNEIELIAKEYESLTNKSVTIIKEF
jgi:hypothetical protein